MKRPRNDLATNLTEIISPSLLGFLDRDRQEVEMKPRAFIGSSTSNIVWAKLFQRELESDGSVEVSVWTQGIFRPMDYPLESLIRKLDEADFGIFICVPEDAVVKKKTKGTAVRDNVLVELGLYLGRLGRPRSFIAVPEDAPKDFLPTDFAGLNPVTFDTKKGLRQDAVGAACGKISEQIRDLGPKILERQTVSVEAIGQLAVGFSALKSLLDNQQFLNLSIEQRMNTAIGIAHGHAQSVVDHTWPDRGVVVSLKLPSSKSPKKYLNCYYLPDRVPPRRMAISPPRPKPNFIPIRGSIAGAAYTTGEPVFVESIGSPPEDLKLDKEFLKEFIGKVGSVAACPIRLHDEIAGVAKLDAEQIGFFHKDDPRINAVLRSVISCFELALRIAAVGSPGLGSSLAKRRTKQKNPSR